MEIKVKGTEPLWVALWVKPQTKKKLKVMCAKEGKTFDQILQKMMCREQSILKRPIVDLDDGLITMGLTTNAQAKRIIKQMKKKIKQANK